MATSGWVTGSHLYPHGTPTSHQPRGAALVEHLPESLTHDTGARLRASAAVCHGHQLDPGWQPSAASTSSDCCKPKGSDASQLHPDTATIQREALQRIMTRCVELSRASGRPNTFLVVLGESFALNTSRTSRPSSPPAPHCEKPLARSMAPTTHQPKHGGRSGRTRSLARIILRYDHPGSHHRSDLVISPGSIFTTTLTQPTASLGPDALRNTPCQPATRTPRSVPLLTRGLPTPIEYNAPIDAIWFERSLLDRFSWRHSGAPPDLPHNALSSNSQRQTKRTRLSPTLCPTLFA